MITVVFVDNVCSVALSLFAIFIPEITSRMFAAYQIIHKLLSFNLLMNVGS